VCVLWWNFKGLGYNKISQFLYTRIDLSSLVSPFPIIFPLMEEDHWKVGYIIIVIIITSTAKLTYCHL